MVRSAVIVCVLMTIVLGGGSLLAQILGDGPRLGPMEDRITQDDIESGDLNLRELRRAGLKIFTTPFNKADGFGENYDVIEEDHTGFGNRPTLQNNGTFLRINGLDAQTCQECHGVVSNATVPVTLGIGGSGTTATVAMFMAQEIDVDDEADNGFADYDGRLIVPPALYGVGGVQLVGKEMTEDLQELREFALDNPDVVVELETKGVSFGTIVADDEGNINYDDVEGVDNDLVIKPFGRKGEFATVRQFDQVATQFHMGMQPVEIVGEDVDADGDGVENEILVGELSALEIFLTTQDRPQQDKMSDRAEAGLDLFEDIGCADCHIPELTTERRDLGYSLPEINEDPFANEFHSVDLTRRPTRFKKSGSGIRVPMFSDLKRHFMGTDLEETFQGATDAQNGEFITAKLWGVADTAPYLHDGRAQTLHAAIDLHGGDAQDARDEFADLSDDDKTDIIAFLRTLRNPVQPNKDVVPNAQRRAGGPLDRNLDDDDDDDDDDKEKDDDD